MLLSSSGLVIFKDLHACSILEEGCTDKGGTTMIKKTVFDHRSTKIFADLRLKDTDELFPHGKIERN
jgi:hypothetical protein